MTPRELIASEITRQYPASADGPTLADRILTRLRYAGFAIVPRVATPEMVEAAVMTFVRENGGIEHAPAMTWRAMVAAAENT